MKALTSILIVEPSDIIIEGLKNILYDADDFNILAPLHDAQALEERLASQKPDIVIINPLLLMPNIQQSLEQLRRSRKQTTLVAINYHHLPTTILTPFTASISLYDNRSTIIALLRDLADNDDTTSERENYELSDRETEVLILLSQGMSSKQIADHLNISIHTVNTHRKNITHKTGIKSIAGLAVYATLHNLI